jgi:hypothetical protein
MKRATPQGRPRNTSADPLRSVRHRPRLWLRAATAGLLWLHTHGSPPSRVGHTRSVIIVCRRQERRQRQQVQPLCRRAYCRSCRRRSNGSNGSPRHGLRHHDLRLQPLRPQRWRVRLACAGRLRSRRRQRARRGRHGCRRARQRLSPAQQRLVRLLALPVQRPRIRVVRRAGAWQRRSPAAVSRIPGHQRQWRQWRHRHCKAIRPRPPRPHRYRTRRSRARRSRSLGAASSAQHSRRHHPRTRHINPPPTWRHRAGPAPRSAPAACPLSRPRARRCARGSP